MTFDEKLKKLRKEQNLTQDDLAEKIFVTRTAISKWETGQGYPSIESLKLLAKLFNISIDELISDEDVEVKINQEKQKDKTSGIIGWVCLAVSVILSGVAFGTKVYWVFALATIFAFATCVMFNLQLRSEHNTSKAKRITMQIFTFISMFIAIGGFICLCIGI